MIYLKKSYSNQELFIYLNKFKAYFVFIQQHFYYFYDFVEFSASLLQSSVSHDPSEFILICWFAAQ